MELVDFSNKYFNTTEPWKVIQENRINCENLCYQYLSLIVNISILLNPFIPSGTNKVAKWLNINIQKYDFQEIDTVNIGEFNPLYSRIN